MKRASISFSRREMLFGLAGATAAFAQPRNRMYNPLLAAHTSIWLVEAELHNQRLPDILDEAFRDTRRAGFRRVELVSEFLVPELRDRTLSLLEQNRLEPSVVYATGALHEQDAAEESRRRVLEIARLVMGRGANFLNFNVTARPQPKTDAELSLEAYQLNRMGEDLQKNGLNLMVHHGAAEMQEGAREWRYWVAHTEPKLVSFCLDVDTVSRAGLNPVALIDTANARLRSLHLRNPRHGENQELLRDGDIDMAKIARLLRQMSYDGYLVVELLHDPNTRREYPLTTALSLSRWYMQEVFGTRPGNPPVDMGPHVRVRS